jgi:hypothetical protein
MNTPPDPQKLKRAFEKLYNRFGPKQMDRFKYLVYSDKIQGLGPEETPNDNPPPNQILTQHEAQKLVAKAPKPKEETLTTKPYKIYRAGRILSLHKTSQENHPIYKWESHPGREENHLLNNSEQKLLWPERQKNALISLLRNATKIALNSVSNDLGANPPPFITICKVELPDEEYARAIITTGKTKAEANQKAKETATQLWREDPEIQAYQEGYRKKILTCLTLRECKKVLHLLQHTIDKP